MTMVPALRMTGGLLLAAALALGLPAQPCRAETFGDWRLDCPAAGQCRLSTQGVEEQTGAALFTLSLAAGRTALALAFTAQGARPDDARAMQWEVDGRLVHVLRPEEFAPYGDVRRLFVTGPAAGAALLPALKAGTRLRISFLDAVANAHDAVFSLAGLSAGLEALVARSGGTDASRIAAPEALPPVARPDRHEAVAALGIPYAVLERHARTSDCEATESPALADADVPVAVLGNTATLYAIPCTVSGKVTTYRLYMRDSGEIGGIETLVFALHDPRFGWIGSELLTGVSYDRQAGLLLAEYVGRSDRVCGYRAAWRWQEHAFALASFEGPADCRDAGRPANWRRHFPAR